MKKITLAATLALLAAVSISTQAFADGEEASTTPDEGSATEPVVDTPTLRPAEVEKIIEKVTPQPKIGDETPKGSTPEPTSATQTRGQPMDVKPGGTAPAPSAKAVETATVQKEVHVDSPVYYKELPAPPPRSSSGHPGGVR